LLSRSHSEYVEGTTLLDMITEDLVAERIAIDSYQEIAAYFADFDSTTRRMIEEIQASEEEHADDLAELIEGLPKSAAVQSARVCPRENDRPAALVANYNMMGPVKAALEAACRYLAYELGPQGIRVHAISPGPLKTRAASGLKDFEHLLNEAAQKAPLGELVDIMDVGFACAYLATSLARRITGGTVYVDGGANIVA
jgi:hypothetical protein